MEQSKPTEEGRYGFGTTPAFESFIKTISNQKIIKPVVLVVNIATLLRNALSKVVFVNGLKMESKTVPLNTTDTINKVKNQIVDMANEMSEICNARFADQKNHILFYLTDNTKQVPREWVRPHNSETSTKLDAAIAAFPRVAKSLDQTSGCVTLHVRLANQMRAPSFRGIEEALKTFAHSSDDIHMISHMPLDYHVASLTGREGLLYRSHTGAVVSMTPSSLADVVFKNEDVPFYPITHILLGDKYLIKGSLARKEKDRLISIAKELRLKLRSNEYVTLKVKENGFIPEYKLT